MATVNRPHESVVAQLLAVWGALPRGVRRFAADLSAVFAYEGRRVPARVAWIGSALGAAAVFLVVAWLLFCAAAAWWLDAAFGFPIEVGFFVMTGANLVFAAVAATVAYRALKTPFFPVTASELHRLSALRSGEPLDPPDPERTRGMPEGAQEREAALQRSETELQAQIALAKRATPRLLSQPRVIASAALLGVALGWLSSHRKERQARITQDEAREAKMPLGRRLVNTAAVHLFNTGFAIAVRELQRRMAIR